MNAKEEFLRHVGSGDSIICATVFHGNPFDEDNSSEFNLCIDHTDEEYAEFLTFLDFDYDNGYGIQTLYGTIWYADGKWSTRGEYDGSEWWQCHACPEIPSTLHSRVES